MSKIWTAERSDGGDNFTFEVLDEKTGEKHAQKLTKEGVALKFALGGYPPIVAIVTMLAELPWRFRETDGQIYLDGPSVGVDDYHSIDSGTTFQQLVDQYDGFKAGPARHGDKNDLAKARVLLGKTRESGKTISNPEKRSILLSIARDLGETIFIITHKYPSVRLEPLQ